MKPNGKEAINVIIVEDNDIIREGLAMLINGTDGFYCTASFPDCESMLEAIEILKPDVLLMDIQLPGMSGIEGVKRVKKIFPELDILILTIYEESDLIFEALCAGASGYLVKKTPPSRLLEAIKETYEGGSPMSANIARKVVNLIQHTKFGSNSTETISPKLIKRANSSAETNKENSNFTEREHEILNALVQGNSYQAIADSLFISTNTVRYHIRNIYRKLHVHSQSEAVSKALRKGLV